MATPKHILRIHDTEANLFANLKDTQIAFATDTNRIIWREGSSFWTFDAGLKWNGTNFEGNEVSTGVIKVYQFNGTEALQIGDGGGNPNLLTTGILTLNADQLKLTLANTTGSASKLLAVTGAGKVVEIDVIAPTMQETYDNSSDPEILTDATRGALTLKRGSSLDSDNVLEVLNGAGTITWAVSGDGVTSFKTTTNGSPTNGDVWSDGTRTNIQGNLAINGTNQGIQGNRGDDDYLYITNRSSVNNGANIKLIDSSVDGEYGNLRIYTTDVLDWYQNYIKSYVPIRFDSSILNPSPINGEIWYDGVNLVGREGSVTGKIAYKNVDNNFSADQTFQGNANIGDVLNLASTTNASPTNGDIWLDSTTTELMAVDSGTDKHTLSVGLGYLNGAVDTISNGDTQTYSKVFRTPATWTGSPYSGANGDNQGYLFNFLAGSSLYGTQLFLGQDGWNQGEAKVRCLNNGTWGDWQNIFISKDGANGVLPLRNATNSSPTNGDIWNDGTNVNVQGDVVIDTSTTESALKFQRSNINNWWIRSRSTNTLRFSSYDEATGSFLNSPIELMPFELALNGKIGLNSYTNASPTTGDIWLDSTSGAVEIASPISASGTSSTINSKHIVNRLSKTITLENPTAADTIPIFRTDKAITIDKISYEIIGSTNCVFDIEWGNNAGGAGTVVTSSPMTANATQAETTTFSDATISANNYLQLDVNSISGTPDYITVTIHYTMDAND